MSGQLNDWLGTIIASAVSVVSAFSAMLIYLINTKKKKLELEQSKTELENEKIKLERSIVENSFIICPYCGNEIKLAEMQFHTDKKEIKHNL